MLALNITVSPRSEPGGETRDVRSRAERWWVIPDSTLRQYADVVLAVDGNIVAAAYEVRGWRRDPEAGNEVVFDLAEAPEWQWVIGQDSPVTWRRTQANPVRKVGGVLVDKLRSQRPGRDQAAHGWSLEVDPGGNAATVRGPGSIAVTALHDGSVRLTLTLAARSRGQGKSGASDVAKEAAG
jgi:hypothetical protein